MVKGPAMRLCSQTGHETMHVARKGLRVQIPRNSLGSKRTKSFILCERRVLKARIPLVKLSSPGFLGSIFTAAITIERLKRRRKIVGIEESPRERVKKEEERERAGDNNKYIRCECRNQNPCS